MQFICTRNLQKLALGNRNRRNRNSQSRSPESRGATEEKPAFYGGGAARGTAYHRMLQHLSFARCRSFGQVTEEMDKLVQEGKVSAKERKLTDSRVLWEFSGVLSAGG